MNGVSGVLRELGGNAYASKAQEVKVSVLVDQEKNVAEITVTYNGRNRSSPAAGKESAPANSSDTMNVFVKTPKIRRFINKYDGGIIARSYRVTGNSHLKYFTTVKVSFNSPDRELPPMGDIPAAVARLYRSSPRVNLKYTHKINGTYFKLDFGEVGRMFTSYFPSTAETAQLAENFISENLYGTEARKYAGNRPFVAGERFDRNYVDSTIQGR